MGKMQDVSFVQTAYMVIGGFISLQLFEIMMKLTEMNVLLKKAASSLSHVEVSLTSSCGNVVKILRSHFEKLSYIEMRLMTLVGDRHDTARMLAQIVENFWEAKAQLT